MSSPEQTAPAQPPKRQFVNFVFYKIDPAWRRLPEAERTKGKQEFLKAVEEYAGRVLVVAYSAVGIRGDCDFMLWRISYDLPKFQEMAAKLLATDLGKYLTTPYSYLSLTKRSIYVDKHIHEDQEGRRLRIRHASIDKPRDKIRDLARWQNIPVALFPDNFLRQHRLLPS